MKEDVKIVAHENIFILREAGDEIRMFQNFFGLSFEHTT